MTSRKGPKRIMDRGSWIVAGLLPSSIIHHLLSIILFGLTLISPVSARELAGSVVKSKEWIVHRGAHTTEEFIGDMSYKAGGDKATADWALYDHDSKTWNFRGNVFFERQLESGKITTARGDESRYNPKIWSLKGHVSLDRRMETGDVYRARGDECFFDQEAGSGWLTARRRVSYERRPPASEPDEGEADRIDWPDRRTAVLFGDVRIWGPRLESWSSRADWSDPERRITLSGGRPVALKKEGLGPEWIGAVKGDQITAWPDEKRMIADGRVVGWIEFKKEEKKGKKAR